VSFQTLATVAIAGACSHLVLDVLSGGRLRPLWPLIGARITLPLVAMADPWLLSIFLAGAVALWLGTRQLKRVATAILTAAALLLVMKRALLISAERSAAANRLTPQASEARWGSLTQWYMFERQPHALQSWIVDGRGRAPVLWLSVPLLAETPAITASRSLDPVRNFLAIHELAFPRVRAIDNEQSEVQWSDIRYCWRDAAANPIECALWFGGAVDNDGRPISEP
jgi:hypothetical protein